jgi:hypothetical protein
LTQKWNLALILFELEGIADSIIKTDASKEREENEDRIATLEESLNAPNGIDAGTRFHFP